MTNVGKVLARARASKKKSLAVLGAECGCTAQYLAHIEAGKCPMSAEVFVIAAEALQVPVSRFVNASVKDYRRKLEARVYHCG